MAQKVFGEKVFLAIITLRPFSFSFSLLVSPGSLFLGSVCPVMVVVVVVVVLVLDLLQNVLIPKALDEVAEVNVEVLILCLQVK